MFKTKCTAILGAQWGDEGKGKLVDAISGDFSYICRATGGANAGHTIIVDGIKHVFHVLPSGMLHEGTIGVIGNGVVLHMPTLAKEIRNLEATGAKIRPRVKISDKASLLLDYHMRIDAELERMRGEKKIGTTCRGIGPCYTEKIARRGLKMADLRDIPALKAKIAENCAFYGKLYSLELDPGFEFAQIEPFIADFLPMITDTSDLLAEALRKGEKILLEGAQGFELDVDHGTYPFVTSSNVSIGGFVTGLGVPPQVIGRVIGIVKAYTSRVGEGPFPTELLGDLGDEIREKGAEYGATTGRPRRVGWLDLKKLQKSIQINGITDINITKLDILSGFPEIFVRIGGTDENPEYKSLPGWQESLERAQKPEDLPENARKYLQFIEDFLGVPISSVGVGPGRESLVRFSPVSS